MESVPWWLCPTQNLLDDRHVASHLEIEAITIVYCLSVKPKRFMFSGERKNKSIPEELYQQLTVDADKCYLHHERIQISIEEKHYECRQILTVRDLRI